MRSYFLALMGMLLINSLRADVVFSNTNTTSQSLETSDFALNFRVTTSGSSVTGFKLFRGSNGGSLTATFRLDSNSSLTRTASYAVDGYTFDLTALDGANNISSSGSHLLNISSISGTNYLATTSNVINNNPATGFYDTSYGGTPTSFARFEVIGAVPEPGTLLLGGIAAVTGGTGVWWKRRKKATCKVNK